MPEATVNDLGVSEPPARSVTGTPVMMLTKVSSAPSEPANHTYGLSHWSGLSSRYSGGYIEREQ